MAHYPIIDILDAPGKAQDAARAELIAASKCTLGVLADGVSSSAGAAKAAQHASTTMFHLLYQHVQNAPADAFNYPGAYESITTELREIASIGQGSQQANAGVFNCATTLITAWLQPGMAQFSFMGNGAILEIRQSWFNHEEQNIFWFGLTNFLNPHIRQNGPDTPLYKTLKGSANQETNITTPDILTIQSELVDESYYLICSDGLFTQEEASLLYNGQTDEYFRREHPMLACFLRMLRQYKQTIAQNPESFRLAFRHEVTEKQLLYDDLSYILFIPDNG